MKANAFQTAAHGLTKCATTPAHVLLTAATRGVEQIEAASASIIIGTPKSETIASRRAKTDSRLAKASERSASAAAYAAKKTDALRAYLPQIKPGSAWTKKETVPAPATVIIAEERLIEYIPAK